MEQSNEALKLDISTEEWTQKLAEAPIFAKKGKVVAEVATEPTPITTILENGTVETTNTAETGDVIVTNPGGEQYILKPDNFGKRYEATDELTEDGKPIFRAKGMARAVQNNTGQPIEIMAPWGEPQFGDPDCMVATVYDPEYPDEIGEDRYIIGRQEFLDTYGLAEEVLEQVA